jgi:hypothetical protein
MGNVFSVYTLLVRPDLIGTKNKKGMDLPEIIVS